jgi:hypothetical protein
MTTLGVESFASGIASVLVVVLDERATVRYPTIVARRAGVIQFSKVDGDFIARTEEEPMDEHPVVRDIDLLVEDASLPVARCASQ